MVKPTLLMQELNQARRGKRERIALLAAGQMRTVLHGIDVIEATFVQECEERELIENVLKELGASLED